MAVSQWVKVPQLVVFMVCFLTEKPSQWIFALWILDVSQISSLKFAHIILFGFDFSWSKNTSCANSVMLIPALEKINRFLKEAR